MPTAAGPVAVPVSPTTPPDAFGHSPPVDLSLPVPRIDGYRVTGPLGAGGMGVVWRAVQLSTQREVALKLMGAATFGSERARLRFDREVELTARLEHPHIARVYDSGLHQGVYFYAMELIDGGVPLDRFVCDRGLARRDVLALVRAVAAAVQYAHQRGVIHRDLKPGNVLVTPDGQPHVLDFGLAKLLDEGAAPPMTIDGELAGTPAYMSPEQAAGRAGLDTRTDVYSLGVILFELLTGRTPHDVTGPQLAVLQRIATEEPLRPRQADPTIDAELETVLCKALAVEPEQRYASAGDLARDLDNYLRGEPLLARRATTWYVLRKRVRRHRWPLAAAGAVLALVAGMALYGAARISRERDVALDNAERAGQREREAQEQRARAVEQERVARRRLMEGLVFAGDSLTHAGEHARGRASYVQAWDLARALGLSALPATTGLIDSAAASPPALLGPRPADGAATAGRDFAHPRRVTAIELSPDGRRAVTAGEDGTIRMWDVPTGTELRRFPRCDANAASLAWDYDRGLLLSGHANGAIRLWDVAAGRELKRLDGHQYTAQSVAFFADGTRILSAGSDNTVRLWDLSAGRVVRVMRGHRAAVFFACLSPDERQALSASQDYSLKLWDLSTGRELKSMAVGRTAFMHARFLPDGRTAVSANGGNNLHVWDLASGELLRTMGGHTGGIAEFQVLPDGRRVITGSYDQTVRLWDAQTGAALGTLGHGVEVNAVAVSADGRVAMSGGHDGSFRVWSLDAPQGNVVFRGGGSTATVRAVDFACDGRVGVRAGDDREVTLWDVATGRVLRSLRGHEQAVMSVAVAGDGRTVVSGSWDGTVRVWDALAPAGQASLTLRGHAGQVWTVGCSRDGRTIVSAGADGAVGVWTLEGASPAAENRPPVRPRWLRGHDRRVIAVAVSRDGTRALSGGDDRDVVLWDVRSGAQLHRFTGGRDVIRTIAFCPDGRTAVVGGFDRRLRWLDLEARREVRGVTAHSGYVKGVAPSPDGTLLASAGDDMTVRLWDAAGREIRAFRAGPTRQTSAAFSPDSGSFLAAAEDGSVRLWRLDEPQRHAEFERQLAVAQEALTVNHDDPAVLATFARWYAFRGMNEWAIDFYERARAAGGDVPALDLARCYWQLDRRDDARRAFTRALEREEAPADYLRLCLDALGEELMNVE